jgi:uncharacterized phage protein (TIGR01671 family)
MRPIKFRAWDKEQGLMFNVDAIYFKGSYDYPHHTKEETEGCEIGPGDNGEIETLESSPILMQFTGLLDAKGREIYEGDIVNLNLGKDMPNNICLVLWDERKCGWCFENEGRIYTDNYHYDVTSYRTSRYEVIGNIYEHPELLKEAK